MKYSRVGQPGIVDAVMVPAAEQLEVDTAFRDFIGYSADLRYAGRHVQITNIPIGRVGSLEAKIGDWLVLDSIGNLSVFGEDFFHDFFKRAPQEKLCAP